MPDNAQQQQEVRSVLRQIATSGDEYGKLGKIEDGLFVFDVPGRPGFVFCRIEKEGETEPGICIPLIALDPYVRVKFVRENGVLIAFSADWLDAVNLFGVQAPALGVPLLPMSGRGGLGDSTPTSGNVFIGDGQGFASLPLATAIATYVRYLASGASSVLTLSGGVATTIATTSYFLLAAQSGTADDLDTLTVTGNPRLIVLQADAGDTITVKHSTGNIELNGGADFALTGDKTLALFWDGTNLSDIGAGGSGSASPLTTLGDLYGFDTADARIPVGTDGQVLTADSTQTLGVRWGTGAVGSLAQAFVGYNTVGASTENMTTLRSYLKAVTLAADGLLVSIDAHIDTDAINANSIACWVLDDDAGAPGDIIALGTFYAGNPFFFATSGAARWWSFPISVWLTAGDYWIVIMKPDANGVMALAYDTGGSDPIQTQTGKWASDGGSPTPSDSTREYSIRGSIVT